MQPEPPPFAGRFDFDILARTYGKACLKKGDSSSTKHFGYWISGSQFSLPGDSGTRGAVGAATFEAIEKIAEADTMVVTRLRAEENGGSLCASVWGYAIRLKKAGPDRAEPDEKAGPREREDAE